ncbi:hypothetical protein SAMN04487905_108101 [Actinopolyspora xinjiangensis]|uniref:Uncharacterized protein n=1 Tax=Actinopolyspora xinjiangensis TaxID=405564 RepID=A0A1H0V8Y5_9ACTN|nr:hypothetical protein SAMN04487905_108101 [Actinopolyspora xinjiangensis]
MPVPGAPRFREKSTLVGNRRKKNRAHRFRRVLPVVPVGAGESLRARSGDQNAASSISISELSVFSTTLRREESSGSTFLAKNRTAATLPL